MVGSTEKLDLRWRPTTTYSALTLLWYLVLSITCRGSPSGKPPRNCDQVAHCSMRLCISFECRPRFLGGCRRTLFVRAEYLGGVQGLPPLLDDDRDMLSTPPVFINSAADHSFAGSYPPSLVLHFSMKSWLCVLDLHSRERGIWWQKADAHLDGSLIYRLCQIRIPGAERGNNVL